MDIEKTIKISMLIAISIVLSIIESFIPLFSGMIVGFKLGLANIIILFVLYQYSFKDALLVSIIRIIIVGMLRTGLFSITFMFSITGAVTSIIMMFLAKNTKLSIIGVSVVGAVFHTLGQCLIASLILKIKLIYYMPYLIIFSIISGIIIGFISKELIKHDLFNKKA